MSKNATNKKKGNKEGIKVRKTRNEATNIALKRTKNPVRA